MIHPLLVTPVIEPPIEPKLVNRQLYDQKLQFVWGYEIVNDDKELIGYVTTYEYHEGVENGLIKPMSENNRNLLNYLFVDYK